jgi:hypothetical protein
MTLKAAAAPIAGLVIGGLLFGVTGARPAATVHTFGVSVQGLPSNLGPMESFESLVGRDVNIANWYVDFTTPDFDEAAATAIADQGAVPMITWQPMDSSLPDPAQEPAYTLESIIDGAWTASSPPGPKASPHGAGRSC